MNEYPNNGFVLPHCAEISATRIFKTSCSMFACKWNNNHNITIGKPQCVFFFHLWSWLPWHMRPSSPEPCMNLIAKASFISRIVSPNRVPDDLTPSSGPKFLKKQSVTHVSEKKFEKAMAVSGVFSEIDSFFGRRQHPFSTSSILHFLQGSKLNGPNALYYST